MRIGSFEDGYNDSFKNWMNDFENDPNKETRVLDSTFSDPFPAEELSGFGQVEIKILSSNLSSSFSAKNSASIVLMLTLDKFDAILNADATKKTQEHILFRYRNHKNELDVDVLKVGHHGSWTTSYKTNDAWIKEV